MSTLVNFIEKYDRLANTEEQKLRIEKLKKLFAIKVDGDTNQNTEDWKESLMKIAERRRKQRKRKLMSNTAFSGFMEIIDVYWDDPVAFAEDMLGFILMNGKEKFLWI